MGFLLVMTIASGRLFAAAPADKAFSVAASFFQGANYERAEKEFGKFAEEFPASPRLPEAILYRAQARFQLTNYAGAIELLSAHENAVGAWTDQCLFWIGEAYLKQDNPKAALEKFSRVVKEFPASPRWLRSGIEEANCLARLSDWASVVTLLQDTNGFFQQSMRTNFGTEDVLRGCLLLSEAHLAQENYPAAEAALQPLAKLALSPGIAWERQYVLSRIQFARGQPEQSILSSSNLVGLATSTGQRELLAESVSFRGIVLERLGRAEEALAAYTNNLAEGLPAERQRQALKKIAELCVAQKKIDAAADLVEKFLTQHPDAPPADLAYLTLGELRFRQFLDGQGTEPGPAPLTLQATNLARAEASFENLIKRFPASPLLGKGHLDLGWCYWQRDKLPESQKEFQAAVQALPPSEDQAVAQFKLADCQFRQNNFAAATTNYDALIGKFAALPQARSNLFEAALYHCVRAALAADDLPSATNAMARIMDSYPNGFFTGSAALLVGQKLSQRSNPAEARKILSEFAKKVPQSELMWKVQLAIARTYEEENDWTNAIERYDAWLNAFTNHEATPRAEYYRASANFHAGDETNALIHFTNFVSRFPTNELTPQAQWWIADYFYNAGRLQEAEKNYQLLFQHWPDSELAYQARMMAGRVAVARLGWADAMQYFTNLYSIEKCPADLKVEAMFAYGDALMSVESPETNKLGNYEEAIRVFSRICDLNPTNRHALLAWGEKANCLVQWAMFSHQYDELTNAWNAYQKVLQSPLADGAARSIACVGLSVVAEKQAGQKTGPEKTALLKAALDHCLDVFYGNSNVLKEGERPDPFWVRESGSKAAALAEQLRDWPQALRLYQQLQERAPQLRASLDPKILRVQENLKSNN